MLKTSSGTFNNEVALDFFFLNLICFSSDCHYVGSVLLGVTWQVPFLQKQLALSFLSAHLNGVGTGGPGDQEHTWLPLLPAYAPVC